MTELLNNPRFRALTQAGRFLAAALIQTVGWEVEAAINAVGDIEVEAREADVSRSLLIRLRNSYVLELRREAGSRTLEPTPVLLEVDRELGIEDHTDYLEAEAIG